MIRKREWKVVKIWDAKTGALLVCQESYPCGAETALIIYSTNAISTKGIKDVLPMTYEGWLDREVKFENQ